MDAQGALDSLLGRLTTVLVNEAQLLGGVRGDVEFITDEMESMNGLLLHLTEAQHRDHQVRAWMKQVAWLTRDCEGNIELYIHYVGSRPGDKGLLGYLRRIPRFLRTIPVRHRIATRIRELKVRAREVGDRRQRYGVTVPEAVAGGITLGDYVRSTREAASENEALRRRILLDTEPPADDRDTVSKGIDLVIKWLSEEEPPSVASEDDSEPQLRVIPIVGEWYIAGQVVVGVYEHSSMVTSFDCRAWVKCHQLLRHDRHHIVAKMLEEVNGLMAGPEDKYWEHLLRELQGYLKGKRFLIVLEDVGSEIWEDRYDLLLADVCTPGSAIVMITNSEVAQLYPHETTLKVQSASGILQDKALKLVENSLYCDRAFLRHCVLALLRDTFALKIFMHLIYVNPIRTMDYLQNYVDTIEGCLQLNNRTDQKALMFCYSELPSKYRSCLLYLTIFPKGHIIKTTRLSRRWTAEGLMSITESATVEAKHYLDVLATRGFVSPVEISAAGDIKSCTLNDEVVEFIARMATDVNFVEANVQPELAHRLAIHNRLGSQASPFYGDSNGIAAFLPTLAASSQWQLLKVLDLEGCKGFKEHHLKSICKILLLKYLSLRNTDVTELPKQIKELQCLETLDIRQTKVRVLAKKAIGLPLLKNFLAGHKVAASTDARGSEESILAVRMPLKVQRMKNLEILSHVNVSNTDSELAGVAELLKLRKLGVALHGKNANLKGLFRQIEKLQRCLRSLSIRIDQPVAGENHDAGVDALPYLPQFIENLNISGITSGLPHLIQEHHQLAKITLSEAYFKGDTLRILGKLGGLRCLRLQHKSYIESELAFKEDEFKTLNFLLVEGSDITNISFVIGAAPKLERIVWSFSTMEALSGLDRLPKLNKLELNGDCNLDPVREAIEKHPNDLVLKHNLHFLNNANKTELQ